VFYKQEEHHVNKKGEAIITQPIKQQELLMMFFLPFKKPKIFLST